MRVDRLAWTSNTWMHDRAALVQIAREGKDNADGLCGGGMNGRWTAIRSW